MSEPKLTILQKIFTILLIVIVTYYGDQYAALHLHIPDAPKGIVLGFFTGYAIIGIINILKLKSK